jgi:5-(aminomethyl)-3-furanmethanol phosphate kinase
VSVAVVVRVGGGLLSGVENFEAVLAEISEASRHVPLLVVPGGGPFADAVREVDDLLGLPDEATHWMALLAMDQYAHLIASRLPTGRLVMRASDIDAALDERRIPVLAPYRWMREADPLPHSWDVTSDSISAWVAAQVGAGRLVLVKPPGASGPDVVDPCFTTVLKSHISVEIVTADRAKDLRTALRLVRNN